jgi:uncharacterized membrane protein
LFRERIEKKNAIPRYNISVRMSRRLLPLTQRQILWLTTAGLGTAIIVAGAFLPPLLDGEARSIVMAGYRQICHQIPERSFHVWGHPLALCHRCVGIWAALPLSIALFAVLRRWDRAVASRPGLVLALSLVPLGLDWTADAAGIWANTMLSRLLTGSMFGLVAGYFLARVIVKSVRDSDTETNRPPTSNTSSKGEA